VLSEARSTRLSPAVEDARKVAPQAVLRADQLAERAERAFREDRLAEAQVLGEQANAAYVRATATARQVRADQRLIRAKAELEQHAAALAAIDEEQTRVARETDDLEARARILQEADPRAPLKPGSPERERARADAARSLLAHSRLLCAAARLLNPANAELGATDGAIEALAARLDPRSARAGAAPTPPEARRVSPLDEALSLRSTCLRLLSSARRPALEKAPASGQGDRVLAQLSAQGREPYRDDRGVVVTLRAPFENGTLGSAAREQFAALGSVAKAESVPLLVVLHGKGTAEDADARSSAVAEVLRQAGAPRVETRFVGTALPLLDPKRSGAEQRNTRLEVIFVTPSP
jgi:hypothetical protein